MNKALYKLITGNQAINLQLAAKYMADDGVECVNPMPNTINNVAIIPIFGPLCQSMTMEEAECGYSSYTDIIKQCQTMMETPAITKVVLYINSPGGNCVGMIECANVIKQLSAVKDTVAWSDEMVCSSAFGLANECREIYTIPSARVGNIGVIYTRYNVLEALTMAGTKVDVYFSGADKGIASSDLVAPTDEQKAKLQSEVDTLAEQFHQRVMANRPNVDKEALTGWDYSGEDATNKQLISGTFNDTKEFVSFLFGD